MCNLLDLLKVLKSHWIIISINELMIKIYKDVITIFYMRGKVITKSLVVALLSAILPFIIVSFLEGCVTVVGGDSCSHFTSANMIWSVSVFLISFFASLISFGLKDN